MSHPLPPKKEVALALLEKSKVLVHLDPREDGVIVPVTFRKQPQLVLEIGLNMPVPIPDLRLDEAGMSCTLSFSRQPFYCVIPWESVFAMVGDDGRGMVWPDDVPPEIASQANVRAEQAQRPRAVPAKRALESVRSEGGRAEAGRAELGRAEQGRAEAGADEKTDPTGAPKTDEKGEEKPKAKRGARSKKPRIVAVEPVAPERPVLVALPPPPEPRGPRAVPSEKKRPPQRPAPGKGKRELPPYLRVVK